MQYELLKEAIMKYLSKNITKAKKSMPKLPKGVESNAARMKRLTADLRRQKKPVGVMEALKRKK